MSFTKTKKSIQKKLFSIITTLSLICIKSGRCLAESGIGTAEVQTATENIKRVIISIAMPLRWSTYICKCGSCCNKNDCKC